MGEPFRNHLRVMIQTLEERHPIEEVDSQRRIETLYFPSLDARRDVFALRTGILGFLGPNHINHCLACEERSGSLLSR